MRDVRAMLSARTAARRGNAPTASLASFEFYEERCEGLGERFRDHVDIALCRIQETLAPLGFASVPNSGLKQTRISLRSTRAA